MGWNHLVIEGYCLFQTEDNASKLPCSKSEHGNVGLHCLNYDQKEKLCPYFGFNKARSSLVLTSENGENVASKVFSSDENIANEKEWLKAEKTWIRKWVQKLLNSDGG